MTLFFLFLLQYLMYILDVSDREGLYSHHDSYPRHVTQSLDRHARNNRGMNEMIDGADSAGR